MNRLVHRRTRRWMVVVVIGCLVVVLYLGTRLATSQGPSALDQRIARLISGRLFGLPVVPLGGARIFQQLGGTVPFAVLTVGLALAGAWVGDWLSAFVALAGPMSTLVVTEFVLKPLYRQGPLGTESFPSGHTAALAALSAAMAFLAWRRWGTRGLAVGASVGALLSVLMVLAVVRVDAHTVSEALAGVLVGIATVLCAALVSSWLFEWRIRAGEGGARLPP
jgi:membrane-associated phospholipid phosphatase